MEDSSYQVEETMKETALSRRMKAFALLNLFGYGSLWFVGENIWKKKLPESYVQREDRDVHPAICLQGGNVECGIHAAVPMWYGTTPRMDKEKDRHLVQAGKRYVLKNFTNNPDDAEHLTMFGSFRAVPIEQDRVGRTHLEELPRPLSDYRQQGVVSHRRILEGSRSQMLRLHET